MPLTPDEVLHIARLARLEVADADVPHYAHELSVILDYVAQLAKVDTSQVEADTQTAGNSNVFREDIVTPSLDRDLVMRGAPFHDGVYFMVPKVIGG